MEHDVSSAFDEHEELLAHLARSRAQTDTLRNLATALAAARSVEEVASAIAERVGEVVGASFGNVAVGRSSSAELNVYQPHAVDGDVAQRWSTIALDDSTPLGVSLKASRVVHLGDREAIAAEFPTGLDDADELGLQALASYPIVMDRDGFRAAIGLGWACPTPRSDPEPIEPVLALCGAALRRAWVADEGVKLAALLDTLLQQAPVGFAFFDTDLRYSHVNRRLAEMNGVTVEDHLGRTVGEVMGSELAAQSIPVLEDVLRTGTARTDVEFTRTQNPPATDRTWNAGFYPVNGPDGTVIGVGVVVTDITEERHQQDHLKQLAQRQRHIARRLQTGLLPQRLPDVDGYEICARYEAGTAGLRVGGDWYEVVEIEPDDFAIVVGDAVGHDLDAAIAMSQIRNALTGLGHAHLDPARVIEALDDYAAHTPAVFASTLFYARLTPSTGMLRYSLSGHHPPVLLHADGKQAFFDAPPGPPVGVVCERQTAHYRLEHGDVLIGYTDGLVEHRSEPLEAGEQRLLATARSGRSSGVEHLADMLLRDVPHPERSDDIVLLIVRRDQG